MGFESIETARFQKPFCAVVGSVVSSVRKEMNHRCDSVSYSILGSLEKISVATPNKVLRLKSFRSLPLLSKIRPTMLVSSTTLFGPAATTPSGGSQPGPHCEFGNARPAKPADASVGVSVNAIVASDGIAGSISSVAVAVWRWL